MKAKLFTPSLVMREGKRVRGILAYCKCGYVGEVAVNTLRGSGGGDDFEQETRLAARKLEKLGWEIGNNSTRHRCPDCVKSAEASRKEGMMSKAELKVVQPAAPATAAAPVADGAREMSREDRRIIFEKLNDVYLDENRGYSADWTDAKVAADLGVPRAWVSRVREEMFGPEKSSENIRAAIEEGKAIIRGVEDLRVAVNTANDLVRKVQAEVNALLARSDKIERTLAGI